MKKEAIILAGGLGTRLKSSVPDLPKCMAFVNNKPFIAYLIDSLVKEGVEKFIFSLGYMKEAIIKFLDSQYSHLSIQYSIEDAPLGTGGAVKLSCLKASQPDVIIANGDTLFTINIDSLLSFHLEQNADCTLSLKPMCNFDRYGVVELHDDSSLALFKEKMFYKEGLINGGLYALNVDKFLNESLPQKFSFEKEYLENLYRQRRMYGIVQDTYFIDIGIPEDYQKAQMELK